MTDPPATRAPRPRPPGLGAPRPRLIAALAVALTAALSLVSVITAPAARGETVGSVQAEADVLAQKIATEQNQVDQLSEQYDGARYHLAQVQAEVSSASAALARASAAAARLHTQVVHELVEAYVSGSSGPNVLTPIGGSDPVVAESYLSVATGGQRDILDRLQASRQSLADHQAELAAARQQASTAVETLSAARSAVQSAQAQTTATLTSVKGHLAVLVAQQEAAQQAAAQARPPASLAVGSGASSGHAAAPPTSASPSGLLPSAGPGTAAPPAAAPASPPAPAATSPPAGPAAVAPPPPSPPAAPAAPAPPPPAVSGPPAPTHAAAVAVAVALAQVGKPYVYGAAGPGSFDCSGLVQYAYGAAGVYLPHYTVAQWDDTAHISLSALQPGDLIFFYSDFHHVGIYLGGGMMVDAPHTGAFVRVESVNWFGPIAGASRVV